MAIHNSALVQKYFFFLGFLLCISVLLTSVAGHGVAEIPPGGLLVYTGEPCKDDAKCTQICDSKGLHSQFGGYCKPKNPPGPTGDCYCKM
ncbi:hypothetical protein Q3G72_004015 [Acer saccharum]|nr:hypothetical protein Q3G72_004015 [Acer saccharum]